MNASESTAMPMSGSSSLSSSITCHWQLSLRTKCSAFTVDYHLASIHWIKSASLIVSKRRLMRAPFVISCGLILMTDVVGALAHVALAIASDRIYQSSLTTRITWRGSPVRISSSWMDITGHMKGMSSLSSQPLTTATDVVMRPLSWRLMSSWSIICKSTIEFINYHQPKQACCFLTSI